MKQCDGFPRGKKVATIYLDGNPSTGYKWQYNIADECVAKVIDEEYIPDYCGQIGSGGTYLWVIKGLRPGKTEIMFNYIGPWQNSVSKSVTYVIRVDSNLNVTVRKKSC